MKAPVHSRHAAVAAAAVGDAETKPEVEREEVVIAINVAIYHRYRRNNHLHRNDYGELDSKWEVVVGVGRMKVGDSWFAENCRHRYCRRCYCGWC